MKSTNSTMRRRVACAPTDWAQEEGEHVRKLIAGAALALIVSGAGGTAAFAGEVNGKGEPTPIRERAQSACAFSGLEDGLTLIGFNEQGPIIIEVPTGPGLVQNPHQENAAGIIHEPGIPGQECRGNLDSDL
jgi:hypothetical protein